MHIGLTYDLRQDYLDAGFSDEATAEFDSPATIEAIDDVLRLMGHRVDRVGRLPALVTRLNRGDRWDLVFNIAEGMFGLAREAQVPALLDAYEIPYTFSDALLCALTLHKGMTKRIIRDLGLPTADFAVIDVDDEPTLAIAGEALRFPLFVKPVAEGTSKGVTRESKVETPGQLERGCRRLLDQFHQPVLVESYLGGREFTVGIVGTGGAARVVGVMEVILLESAEQEGYSYENKQQWQSRLSYTLASGAVADEAAELALCAWRGLGCRDGGRIDVRADASGALNFIEVNPLPGLNPQYSDLPVLANLAGWTYPQLIGAIVESAMMRVNARSYGETRQGASTQNTASSV